MNLYAHVIHPKNRYDVGHQIAAINQPGSAHQMSRWIDLGSITTSNIVEPLPPAIAFYQHGKAATEKMAI